LNQRFQEDTQKQPYTGRKKSSTEAYQKETEHYVMLSNPGI
jgi:hypothetical protein